MRWSAIVSFLVLSLSCGAAPPRKATSPTPSSGEASSPAPSLPVVGGSRDQEDRQDRELVALRNEVRALRHEVARLEAAVSDRDPGPRAPSPPPLPRPNRPDPSVTYAVPIADRPWRGAAAPLVTIVKGYEYACPFCEKSRTTIETLLKEYKGDLRVVYRHFIVHPSTATEPARAACAADEQGKFQAMDTLLWDEAYRDRKFARDDIESLARRAGLNMKTFRRDRDGHCAELVKKDQAELAALGQSGTPTFWINGRPLTGARPVEQFRVVIEEELARARAAIGADSRLRRQNYYERHVLAKGHLFRP